MARRRTGKQFLRTCQLSEDVDRPAEIAIGIGPAPEVTAQEKKPRQSAFLRRTTRRSLNQDLLHQEVPNDSHPDRQIAAQSPICSVMSLGSVHPLWHDDSVRFLGELRPSGGEGSAGFRAAMADSVSDGHCEQCPALSALGIPVLRLVGESRNWLCREFDNRVTHRLGAERLRGVPPTFYSDAASHHSSISRPILLARSRAP